MYSHTPVYIHILSTYVQNINTYICNLYFQNIYNILNAHECFTDLDTHSY